MSAFRDIKRKARRDLHEQAKVPALYLAPNGTAKPIHVRVHSKWDATSIDSATNNGTMVSRQSAFPKVLFMLDEIAEQAIVLRTAGIVSVEPGEAYRLDHAEAPDGISVSWFVTQLDTDDTVDLPVPADG